MRAKLIEWLARYLPLEIAATACSLAGGLGAAAIGMNAAIVAYAATWAENAGFYGYALAREMHGRLTGAPLSMTAARPALLSSSRSLLAEFGLLAIVGIVSGLVFAWVAAAAFFNALSGGQIGTPEVDVLTGLMILAGGLGGALLASWFPARSAATTDILDVLRAD